MKLGVMTVLLGDMSLEAALDYLKAQGVQAVEVGSGGCPGDAHCKPAELLADEGKLKAFKDAFDSRGVELSALSCHGNAVHPNKELAQKDHETFERTVLLAEKLGVKTVVTFGGCPGDHDGAKYPNWVTCAWPDDYQEILKYQWDEVLIPYWKKAAAFAKEHGVRVALEMHPGFMIYNPETLLRLREAVGDTIGANVDPSHLFWQGIDPVAAIRALEGAIYHFHAKDTKIDPINCPVNGVLDYKHYGEEIKRSWIFRTLGYGHDLSVWKDMISALRLVGYDGIISIEHEDSLMTRDEGLRKAINVLKEAVMFEGIGEMFWA